MQTTFSEALHSNRNRLIRRTKDAISTELDGETVILNIDTGIYSGLDQVGTTIWNTLAEPATFFNLKERIMADYEVSEQRCSDDLCAFLDELLKNRLITLDDGETA
ncbi:PqqD family peptide modification chaperone [Desulfofustis glycolicus]|uniref:Coenzyme PQQ synthesis protein D (PqqD) n=1 Tax=Desulfofustis glycolicus DSM 9705 TaxID=1121409 RepID=A0A1M5X6I7_9BACT|nr:PqqD family peptide modification chaperone [Desulfofustis glycolicus]MCB2216044.1 PqqD family peptide modification chaperone [Desulfobulbaceae bacterium]SHH95262.1 Coenzyme PQQ synthesis protein D (PqqD) [Desulfofustis glycolicus DSM 9705]